MKKNEIELIIKVNLCLTRCKVLRPFSPITKYVSLYLQKRIDSIMRNPEKMKSYQGSLLTIDN